MGAKRWSTALSAALIAGCASTADLQPGDERGQTLQVSGHAYAEVWDAAMDTVISRLRLVRSDKDQGRIEAQSGVSAMSWGEVVTVIVDPATDADSHTVEVISAKKMTITGRNWAPMLLAEISHRLD